MILDASGKQIAVPGAEAPARMVEIVRSFSFKLNLGNYQSADFFASQKQQCGTDEADTVSADLYDWCYSQVMDSVRDVQRIQAAKAAKNAA